MTWEDKIRKVGPMFPVGEAECKISLCEATSCKHNENRNCTLPEVTVDNRGQCRRFEER